MKNHKQKKHRNKNKSKKNDLIINIYEMFDDDDISTERLLAMTADYVGCDVSDVVEALISNN